MSVTPLLWGKEVRSHCFVTIAALALLASQSSAASSPIRYVNAGATGGHNGKTWANSYTNLQDALAEASDPGNGITQIWVAAGTYLPDGGRVTTTGLFSAGSGSQTASFVIPAVTVYGGFAGGETLLSLRNVTAHLTRLSGDLHRDDGPAFTNRSDNSQHVLQAVGVQGAVLDGFTISGGETTGYGGGLYADNATVGLVNCTFSDNRAGDPAGNGGGGALYVSPTARIVVDKGKIDGTLLLLGEGLIQNANIQVSQARLEGEITLQNNELELIETSAGFGGEFFVGGNVQVLGNHITSEGDRYLDLDPDADNQNLLIHDNTIDVKILPIGTPDEDTLLELRGLDLDCIGANCPSGAFPAPAGSPGFTADPSDNWVLESLEVLGDPGGANPGRVTLTNREGYQFQSDLTHPETVYVKTLKLHPYAVLNTALQRLYYQHLYLVDGSGVETEWTAGPPYPAEFSNHSAIVDHSILGFSLVQMGFDDPAEFEARVHYRTTDPKDPNDPPPANPIYVGEVTRINVPSVGGVMQMATHSSVPGKLSASSVAAKGSFARAGAGEKLGISFDYSFRPGCNPNAELIVRLAQDPTVGAAGDLEVARIRPPPPGQPGSIGGDFATFSMKVPRGSLNFTHGTYVELVLTGTDSLLSVPILNPVVVCRPTCGDIDGVPGVTATDFLVLLASYGGQLSASGTRECLDSGVSKDYFVDIADVIGWSALKQLGVSLCSASVPRERTAAIASSGQSVPSVPLLVTGKQALAQNLTDRVYPYRQDGSATGTPLSPGGGASSIGNGRLIRDGDGKTYQITADGLVRLNDGQTVITAGSTGFPDGIPSHQVYVGFSVDDSSQLLGLPVADAVFDRSNPSVIYVVPVVVGVPAELPAHYYRAAARLKLDGSGRWIVEQLYGTDPYTDPLVQPNDPADCPPYDVQRSREIELDRTGQYLFITSSSALNYHPTASPPFANDWLLIFRTSGNPNETRQPLVQLTLPIRSPTALHASAHDDYLYLASSINPAGVSACAGGSPSTCCTSAESLIYRLQFHPLDMSVSSAGAARINSMQYITDIAEPPSGLSIVAVGLNAPVFPNNYTFSGADAIFTCPRLARLTSTADWTGATATPSASLSGHNLALPLSVLAADAADLNGDGKVDSADLDLFRACATRAGVPYSPTPPPGCSFSVDGANLIPPDFDDDGDVDLDDFAEFQREYR